MIITYMLCCISFILGYFVACLMMIAKGNTQTDIDYECHSFNNKDEE
ncbi:hypothetical protein H8D85_00565 [bacterium]|nr:hypothetical protein [bacterium]